jgi:SPP1 gp7 family putative phage head morphogenesis protein
METDEAVEKALNELWIDEESVPSYLNTLVRTNTFEALNEARYDAFTDPDMAGFVVAFEYAAVLDSSTTDICEHLNGKTYAADSPVWNEYRPPNHFNCRSILIAITAVDGWDGQEDDPPTVEAQKGFA